MQRVLVPQQGLLSAAAFKAVLCAETMESRESLKGVILLCGAAASCSRGCSQLLLMKQCLTPNPPCELLLHHAAHQGAGDAQAADTIRRLREAVAVTAAAAVDALTCSDEWQETTSASGGTEKCSEIHRRAGTQGEDGRPGSVTERQMEVFLTLLIAGQPGPQGIEPASLTGTCYIGMDRSVGGLGPVIGGRTTAFCAEDAFRVRDLYLQDRVGGLYARRDFSSFQGEERFRYKDGRTDGRTDWELTHASMCSPSPSPPPPPPPLLLP